MKIIVEAIASLCAARIHPELQQCGAAQSPRESDWYGTADKRLKDQPGPQRLGRPIARRGTEESK